MAVEGACNFLKEENKQLFYVIELDYDDPNQVIFFIHMQLFIYKLVF